MFFKKYIMLTMCVMMLGLSACDTQETGDVTESEKEQENIVEAEENVTELLDAERVVFEQTFDVNLEGWGDVTFVTYKPENEGGDAEYKLVQDNKEIYTFECWQEENYKQTKAVAFKDYNGDGYKDVIIISQHGNSYDVAKVFIQNPEEKSFQIDNLLCEYLAKNNHADSIDAVMEAREDWLGSQTWLREEEISYAESKILADNRDMWLEFPDYANDVEQYVVTDLDKNDRAEIIVSSMGGTGSYTYSRFFEVNETHDGLVELTTDFVEGDSQPDVISFQNPVAVYIDKDFVFHYIVEDYIKVSAAEYYNIIYDLTLKDGEITHRVLARKSEIYNTEGAATIKYEDASGQEITAEAYANIAETVFVEKNRSEKNIWGWQDLKELKDLSEEEIRHKLDESYCKWEDVFE